MNEIVKNTTARAASPLKGGAFVRTGENENEGPEPRVPVSAAVKVLVLLVCTAAATATAISGAGAGAAHYDWPTFLILSFAAAAAQVFVVKTTNHQAYHLAIVFVLAAALLLPPELVALLCLIQHVPEQFKERYPLEIQSFNVSNYVLASLGAWTAAAVVLGSQQAGEGSRTVLAGTLAGVVFVVFNHGLLAAMLRVARGHSFRQTGLFSLESISTDLVLALIGVGLAAWWHTNLWFLPVAIAPLVLIHRALIIPRLRAEASLDPKTGLFNAGHLNSTLAEEMERAARFSRPLSVIVADLDLLRKINNSYGHLSGDAVLLGVAETLREELRPYDVAARFGGEEFAVLLPETEFDDAMAIAERVRQAFANRRFRRHGSDEPIVATLSLGVASFPVHAEDSDELVHQADLALYRSKALGRNRVCGATAETVVLNKLLLEAGRHADAEHADAPRGFRPYGPDRRPVAREGAVSRLATATREAVAATRERLASAAIPAPTSSAERNVRRLIALLTVLAGSLLALNAMPLAHAVQKDAFAFGGFAVVVVALQLLAVDLYGSGAEAASAIGILATGFVLGPGPAMAVAVLAAAAQWIRKHGLLHRGLFDASNFALSAAAAGYAFKEVASLNDSVGVRLLGALVATFAYKALNSGLLCRAMSFDESLPFKEVWNERFRWASIHYIAYGPLAFASALAYEQMGLLGLMAFAVPPALLTVSVRQYLGHTRASVEEVRRANEELRRSNEELAASNQRVKATHLATIAALSRSMEAKDQYTGGHIERVASVAVVLATRLGYRGDELEAIELGTLMHDIGKTGIPDAILHKPGPLTEDEWRKMREHPVISDYILSEVDIHPFVRQIARWSHERIDGQGYPDGLAGNAIPLPARIAFVADAFDALTSDRPYRPGRSTPAALDELRAHAGTQFCPLVVQALEDTWREEPQILGDRHLHAVPDVA